MERSKPVSLWRELRTRCGTMGCIGFGVALLLAGTTKLAESSSEIGGRSWWLVLGCSELGFGSWLLAGFWPAVTRPIAIGVVLCFSLVAVSRVVSGESSCGCFGPRVVMSPWVMTSFDLAILVSLIVDPHHENVGTKRCQRTSRVTLAALGLVGAVFVVIGSRSGPRTAAATPARMFLVNPADWVGRRLPLLDHIDIGDQIAQGSWIVVLHRHDCSACHDVLPRCRSLARDWSQTESLNYPRFAFIEMPPHTAQAIEFDTGASWIDGRLADDLDWFAKTPAVLFIEDGFVRPITDLDALPGAKKVLR